MNDGDKKNFVEMRKARDHMDNEARECRKVAMSAFWLGLMYFLWNRRAYRRCRAVRRDAMQAVKVWESGIAVLNQKGLDFCDK